MKTYLMKYPVGHSHQVCPASRNFSELHAIKGIITRIIGKQFYCGTYFLNTLYVLKKNFLDVASNMTLIYYWVKVLMKNQRQHFVYLLIKNQYNFG